jgi:hypothetical protein
MFGRFLSIAGKMTLALPGLRNTESGGFFGHFLSLKDHSRHGTVPFSDSSRVSFFLVSF